MGRPVVFMSGSLISASSPSSGRLPGAQRAVRAWEQHKARQAPHVLDPAVLPDHIDALYRAAFALCGSREDAEDLVQTTFARVLRRPRIIRHGNERGYLLRSLRNTYSSRYRAFARRPSILPLPEDDRLPAAATAPNSRELMEAIGSAPPPYRDAVIAVDVPRRPRTMSSRRSKGNSSDPKTLVTTSSEASTTP
jgi:RNA polymerase sigma-70 factor (ECF subfamily)